jgi:transcriptional regulator GlxA family with amidase domain
MELHRIAVLALPGVVAFDLGVPSQVFSAARGSDHEPLYRTEVCTSDGGAIRSAAGYGVLPDHDLALLDRAQTVIIPGVHHTEWLMPDGVIDGLRAAAARGARMVSICTGAFALAQAGLLDGRPATTHWAHAEDFTARFPTVSLDPGVLFVDDGDVLSSAGVAAGIDLCLHLVRRDHGSDIANRAARRCVVPAWRDGGQSQFIERPVPEPTGTTTSATRAWALTRLEVPLDLADLASHASMSVRTFTRRFREETGVSPGRWLVRQRIEYARRLLESTDLPIDQVAGRAGFGTTASLRQHLHATVGVSPGHYRRTFRP